MEKKIFAESHLPFLAQYLAMQHKNAIDYDTAGDKHQFIEGMVPHTAEDILTKLQNYNSNLLYLYEYLEEYGDFIHDPMFTLILNGLMEAQR